MVAPGEGHFERHKGKWDVIHVNCVFEQREEKALKKGVAADGEAQ